MIDWLKGAWNWTWNYTHVWASLLIVVIVVWRCMKKRARPTLNQVIELLGYGSGLYTAAQLFRMGASKTSDADGGIGWGLVAAGIVLGLAMLMGMWDVFHAIGRPPIPTGVAAPAPPPNPNPSPPPTAPNP